MTDKRTQAQSAHSNMEKDPQDWVTGDEAMTGAQRSYLKTLSEQAHEPFDDTLTKAQASSRIEELQARTGRGQTPAQAGSPGHEPSAGRVSVEAAADDNPLESIGRAIGETVLGSDTAPQPDRPTQEGRPPPSRP